MSASQRLLTDEQERALAQRYPHEANIPLAAAFGISFKALANLAHARRWFKSRERFCAAKAEAIAVRNAKRPPKAPKPAKVTRETTAADLQPVLLGLARDARTSGLTKFGAMEMTGQTLPVVTLALEALTDSKQITRIECKPLRWFADPVHAREYLAERQKAVLEAARSRRVAPNDTRPADPAPRRMSEPAAAAPAGTAVTRHQQWPGYDPRYHVCPGAEVPRLFSLVPPGCDPMTGRAWV